MEILIFAAVLVLSTIICPVHSPRYVQGCMLWWVHVHKVCELQHLWKKFSWYNCIGKTEKLGNKCKTCLQSSTQIFNTNWIQWFCKTT